MNDANGSGRHFDAAIAPRIDNPPSISSSEAFYKEWSGKVFYYFYFKKKTSEKQQGNHIAF